VAGIDGLGERAGEDHLAQVVAVGQGLGEQGQALGRGDQHPGVAVAQDVADLLGLQDGVDRHEHTARPRRGKAGDNGFGAFVEEDADPLATVQPQADQARGDAGDLVVQLPVAEACLAGGEGRCVGARSAEAVMS
jgi:hypothetical protein